MCSEHNIRCQNVILARFSMFMSLKSGFECAQRVFRRDCDRFYFLEFHNRFIINNYRAFSIFNINIGHLAKMPPNHRLSKEITDYQRKAEETKNWRHFGQMDDVDVQN